MATYLELKKQAEDLAARAEEARVAEIDAMIDDIRAKVEEFGITPNEIFGRRKRAAGSKSTKAALPAKYQDPKTGATWSSRGKAPSWLAGKNRDKYLIPEGAA